MKVSVIYPTARYGGLDILDKCIKNSDYNNIEVLVVDELRRKDLIESLSFKYVEPPDKKPGMWWNLDASLNKAISQSTGDIIVQINDFVYFPSDGISKFVEKIKIEPKALISGISDQFEAPKATNPIGLYSIWDETPPCPSLETHNCLFSDPRKESRYTGFYVTIPLLFEGNWCAYPKSAWFDVGGYDESFDVGWGYDNVEFAERASFFGYHVFLDTNNEVYCYSHIKLFDEQKIRDSAPNNNQLYNKLSRMWYNNLAPVKLGYAK